MIRVAAGLRPVLINFRPGYKNLYIFYAIIDRQRAAAPQHLYPFSGKRFIYRTAQPALAAREGKRNGCGGDDTGRTKYGKHSFNANQDVPRMFNIWDARARMPAGAAGSSTIAR